MKTILWSMSMVLLGCSHIRAANTDSVVSVTCIRTDNMASAGTGFVVGKNLVMTAAHVFWECDNYKPDIAYQYDDSLYTGQVAYIDNILDIAIIEVDTLDYEKINICEDEKKGIAYAYRYILGEEYEIKTLKIKNYTETDIYLYDITRPGYSGSPLYSPGYECAAGMLLGRKGDVDVTVGVNSEMLIDAMTIYRLLSDTKKRPIEI